MMAGVDQIVSSQVVNYLVHEGFLYDFQNGGNNINWAPSIYSSNILGRFWDWYNLGDFQAGWIVGC